MNENILPSFILCDEAKTFFVIEPFNDPMRHVCPLNSIDYDGVLSRMQSKNGRKLFI
jgi:hypothetical protein